MTKFGLYSAGGFSREVFADAMVNVATSNGSETDLYFVDDDPSLQGSALHDASVLSFEAFLEMDGPKKMAIGFADPGLRRRKAEQLREHEVGTFAISAPSVRIGTNVAVGEGAIFAHNSTVTSDARIGSYFHCNIYSYVAHDCVIGDFVTLAPRVSLNGRIVVEDDVYIGSDATFLPGSSARPLTVGKGATVGAGAVVTKSVEPGSVVVGNPARPRSAAWPEQ